ncbi:hypothetical protein QN277_018916 [Acacia crassicarpa]|uniref:Disease resistance protein n=1 Tax=Acacia crassicarpa TaxID=499986 RepID=A0AAE1MUZ4_9FABA|nr:hypothetical protein QN277_018916 [Acacia crassicarpa]
MTSILESVAADIAKRLVVKAIEEFKYFSHFEDHIQDFEIEYDSLVAKRNKVKNDIEAAQRNEIQIEDDVQNWIQFADKVIEKNDEIKQTQFYGWCPPWKYRQGKRLAKRTTVIKAHIQKCEFDKMVRPAELPGMKYHASSKDFIDFESRKKKVKELVEALEDGNHYMIGLQGMGGTGKTTLAIQVGKKLEESKSFEKVIFVVVSNPLDVNKIRGDIARALDLKLEERVEADHSKLLWSRISKNEKKLLIILDDVWGELNLIEIGIPSGLDHKNCYVLITTREPKVCQDMECQPIVRLDTLDDGDALRLFRLHATSELEGLAQDFSKECGGLPIAIVALARSLRNLHVGELKTALRALQNSKSLVDVHDDLLKVYNCLRSSYDNLRSKKAQTLFQLCSIFPEDYQFPINLIIRLGIGSGIFEEADDYCAARSQALDVKNKLIDSTLLQEEQVGEKECIKMHDLVREVAQWIAKEDIQVIKDSRTTLTTNKRFVFWSTNDFPDQFDDTNLEILLLWVSGNVRVKDLNAFFAGMPRLKILFLLGENGRKIPSPSLLKSLLSLNCIHTLILDGWELGDISILKNMQSLVSLEFKSCLIIELPRNIMELKKLRWLGMRNCKIEKNNPFEVIEKCTQLEEVYFVENFNVKDWNTKDDKEIENGIALDISPAELQIFSIAYDGFKRFAGDDNGLLRCFNPEHIKHLVTDAMFKYLVRSAEVFELGKIGQTSWKNLAPDIIPLEKGGMDNLVKLYLYERDDIECLIDNSNYQYSNVTVFSKLVELHLYCVDVKELYSGAMPSLFLWQLQILWLEKCMKLQNIFFDENIKLPYLKVLRLISCPMFQPSIFPTSVAQSLERLEELVVESCEELKSLIAYESLKQEMIVVGSQKNYGLLFPALKSLRIRQCDKLEMVFSLLQHGDLPKLEVLYIYGCRELKYIFGEYRVVGLVLQQEIIQTLQTKVTLHDVPSLISIFQNCQSMPRPRQDFKEDSKEKHENSKPNAFSWAYGCCFLAQTKDTNIGVPSVTMEHHIISQGSCGSSKRMKPLHTAKCLMRHPLSLQNIRDMRLTRCSKLKSLFSVSIATTMTMLEMLSIDYCEELKGIITNEVEEDDHLNCTSIFPELQRLSVSHCNKLEFIFPSTLSGGLQKLKSILIFEAHELKYVFGKYNEEECLSNENENNDEHHIYLPALESLDLWGVPNMIRIAVKKYQQKCPSLQIVEAPKAPTRDTNIVVPSATVKHHPISQGSCGSIKMMETLHTAQSLMRHPLSLQNIRDMTLRRCSKLKLLFNVSIAATMIMLEKLDIEKCEELKHIITNEADDDYHLNCTYIFPKLQSLYVHDCNKLEFIVPYTLYGALQKLKSIDIHGAHELKYVFGKYNEEECLSNEIENNDEPQIHLLALESLHLSGVPNMISIGIKKYQQKCPSLQIVEAPPKAPTRDTNIAVSSATVKHHPISQGSCGTSKRMEAMHTAECLMRHPWSLQNIRHMTLDGCSKLKSLFSVSIATTMIMLEKLDIKDCEELKHVITNEADDDYHLNCTSIFPKLQSLQINFCDKLEFIFPSTLSGGLQKLKSIDIKGAYELKYVFGKYNEEECVSNGNENNETHIHLPALEILSLWYVPNIISIGVNKYQQKCPSLQIVEAPKEIKQHMQDVTSKRKKKSELQEIVNVTIPPTPTVGFQYFLNFHNLKEIVIKGNEKLKTLFSVSASRNLPQLSKLTIKGCEELVNVVEDDSHDHHHMNSSSILPKLEDLSIKDCNKLEFIFPLTLFGTLQKFKSLIVKEAAQLYCIFENESDELHIHLPATLERLSFVGVPKIMNKILAKKYHVSFLSLHSIEFGDLEEFNGRSFLDLMAYLQEMQLNVKVPKDSVKIIKDVQKLTKLGIRYSKIEEVLNLEGVEIEGTVLTLSLEEIWLKDLSELNHIWKGPKYILSLPNLWQLNIVACKKLRVIFNVSIVKSLPQLSNVTIKDCDELVDIIEDSLEGHLHQICFPKLQTISIDRCNSLKCLFSISTSGMFPKLTRLEIEEASELEQVFIRKQDDMQKMTMMEQFFPELSNVTLRKLPMLVTICVGIDFQNVRWYTVNECPKYQGMDHIQEELEDGDSQNQAATNASPDFAESKKETVKEIEAKDPTPALLEKQALEGSTTKLQLRSTSLHNYNKSEKEGGRVVFGPASKLSAPTSSSFQSMEETSIEMQAKDSNQASRKQASETSAAKSHLRRTSLPSIDAILKEIVEEGSTSEDVVATTMVADLAPRNSWDLMPSKSRSETSMAHSLEGVTSSVVPQVECLKSGPSTLSSEKTEKEDVKIQTSRLSIDPTWTNSKITQSIKDTKEHGHADNYAEEYSYSRKQSIGPSDNLPIKDSAPELEDEHKTIESTTQFQHEDRAVTRTTAEASHKINTLLGDYSIDIILKERSEQGPTLEDVAVADLKPRNSSVTQGIKNTMEQGLKDNYPEDDAMISFQSTNSNSRKQSTIGPIDNLSRKDSTMSAKEKAGGVHEKTITRGMLPRATPFESEFTIEEVGDHSSVQKEAKSDEPIKGILSQVITSLYYPSKCVDAGSSSLKLEIWEIFRLVVLKHGEMALLAQALEQYPQLLLPRANRTDRIIALSYRVLVDILIMQTKTPNTITQSEKTTLEANLCDAIVLGFDKDWVESIRAKVLGVNMSGVSATKEEIQVMEVKL